MLEFNGLIEENTSNYDELFIGDKILCETLFYDEDIFSGNKVNVSYYISDSPIDENTVDEQYLLQLSGACEGDYRILCGTEWTGVYGVEELFNVNGHDILEELRGKSGKYCLLQIKILNE